MALHGMFSRRGRAAILALGLLSLLPGCQAPRSRQIPSWWQDPHQHDGQHLYFKAEGVSSRSYEQARNEAHEILRGKLSEYILADLADARLAQNSLEMFPLQELDAAFRDEEGRLDGSYHVWLLGRFPRSEYELIRQRLEKGRKLGEAWAAAQSAIHRGQSAEAEKLLLAIIQAYDQALRPSFAVEEAKLALAGIYLGQRRGLRARQWLADVQGSTTDPVWRTRAGELLNQVPGISLKDAFEDKKVGIYCCARTDGQMAADPLLAQELEGRLAKEGVLAVVRSGLIPAATGSFDGAVLKQIAAKLGAQGADVVLVLSLDIDTTKTGVQVAIPGTEATTDAMDAKLVYYVVRASDGQLLASDSTKGFSNARPGLLNVILTHPRHLPNHAAAIAAGLGQTE